MNNCNGGYYRTESSSGIGSRNCYGGYISQKKSSNCNYGYTNDSILSVLPCENIESVMEILNITERNIENDQIIRDYLYKNCCSKHCTKIQYIKEFCTKILNGFRK